MCCSVLFRGMEVGRKRGETCCGITARAYVGCWNCVRLMHCQRDELGVGCLITTRELPLCPLRIQSGNGVAQVEVE